MQSSLCCQGRSWGPWLLPWGGGGLGGGWAALCSKTGTHEMLFLVPRDCLPSEMCWVVDLLCSIKVYSKQVYDSVFQQAQNV